MVEICYGDGTPVPNPNPADSRSPKTLNYHINSKLDVHLDNIRDRTTKHDSDNVMLIDGTEGSGKSVLAMQMGKRVDPTLDLSRVCLTADEFKKVVINAKPLQKGSKHPKCVIFDEAVTGLSAGDSIARIGKLLKSLMMQMRQKNLFVIIVIPSIFELNKYAVLSRCRSFFHVYESKGKKGRFIGFNRKDTRLIYLKGKKTHSYLIKSKFRGRFFDIYAIPEQEYRDKKSEALECLDETDGKSGESKMTYERKIYLVNNYLALQAYYQEKYNKNYTQKEYCELLFTQGIDMKLSTFGVHLLEVRRLGKIFLLPSLVI